MTRFPKLLIAGIAAAIVLVAIGAVFAVRHFGAAPVGQVAARVGSDEITLQEINTELQDSNIPTNLDKRTVQRQLLQNIIDRKLLNKAAEEDRIDKAPSLIAEKRRQGELLVMQAYAKKEMTNVAVPSKDDVNRFMADRPGVFERRVILTLDQFVFPTPPDLKHLSAFDQDHSIDAVAARLRAMGIVAQRRQISVDSVTIPQQDFKKVEALPQGEPFILPQPGGTTISVITNQRPVPFQEAVAREAALESWRQQKLAENLQRKLDAMKAKTRITYQNGFGRSCQTKSNSSLHAACRSLTFMLSSQAPATRRGRPSGEACSRFG